MRFILFFLLVTSVHAQHSSQPQKESTSDLRSGLVMFEIEDLDDERTLWLERTANLDYFLRMKEEDEDERIQKITTKDAKKLDMEFASKFLKIQYELPPSPEGCEVTLRLNMKGEGQKVCEKEDKKTQEIRPIIKDLIKRF